MGKDVKLKLLQKYIVLLVGGYENIGWEKDILIKEYRYSRVPSLDDNTEVDLPF